jgi:hypothetical protein
VISIPSPGSCPAAASASETPRPTLKTSRSWVEFPNGSTGSIHVSTTSPVNLGEEIVAIGTNGIVAVQADGRIFGKRRDEQQIAELPVGELASNVLTDPDPRVRPFLLLAGNWIASILTGENGFRPILRGRDDGTGSGGRRRSQPPPQTLDRHQRQEVARLSSRALGASMALGRRRAG